MAPAAELAAVGATARVLSDRTAVLRDQVARHTTPHEVTRRAGTLAGRVDVLSLAHCRLVFVRYGGEVVVEAPATGERTVVTVPLGPMVVRQGVCVRSTTFDRGFLLSRSHRTLMQPHPWSGAWVLAADPDALESHRSQLAAAGPGPAHAAGHAAGWDATGRDTTGRGTTGRGTTGWGTTDGDTAAVPRPEFLAAACRRAWALADLPRQTAAHTRAALLESVESTLLTALVVATARSRGERGETAARDPRVVRLLSWLTVHHDAAVTVGAMAGEVGLSVRQLQTAVRGALGLSPTELLREIRMREARRRLLVATPHTHTVSAIAHRCGISHLGRFARDYRTAFGESPSATLARVPELG